MISSGLRSWITTLFGIDLRTLALFRIALGLVLLCDLLNLFPYLDAFYSDQGILPRDAAMDRLPPQKFSFHLFNGTVTYQALLFTGQAILALALIIGYRTRLVTILSWVFYISLVNRNTLIIQGGDILLGALLFWAMFLPLNARFAIDSALNSGPQIRENRYFSFATLGLLLQASYVYVFGALLKTSPVWMPDGDAVYYALHLDSMASPLAHWLRDYPLIMKWLTYFVWWIELLTPLLLFCPIFHLPVRLVTLFLLICMHIGFITFLNIGLFAFISITSLLAFTPGWVWDRLSNSLIKTEQRKIRIYYDEGCSFCKKTCLLLREFCLPREITITPAQSVAEIYALMEQHNSWVVMDHKDTPHLRWDAVIFVLRQSPVFGVFGRLLSLKPLRLLGDRCYGLIARNRTTLGDLTTIWLPYRPIRLFLSPLDQGIVLIFILMTFYVNLFHLKGLGLHMPEGIRLSLSATNMYQKWDMFAPRPLMTDGWVTIKGELRNGRLVDVYHDRHQEPEFVKPVYGAWDYEDYRWRKYFSRIWLKKYASYRKYYGRYLCSRWNRQHREQLQKLTLYYTSEKTMPDYKPEKVKRHVLLRYHCAS
tara:strand:- start:2200 stop:3978 length:1779 start_codon:yes stop_codon:yes gene_type:complete